MGKLLKIKNLAVSFFTYSGEVQAVRGINLELDKGETVAIVGESGCGKSVTAQTIMGLLTSPPAKIKRGSILFHGQNLLKLSEKEMQNIRGSKIGMIFQDPMTSLNPTSKVGDQIAEGLIKHRKMSRSGAKKRALELLEMVSMSEPSKRLNQFPHELSGGMRQRAMIAIALACGPDLLIADEPTTALDVTIQAQILDLMKSVQRKTGTAIILITHDLGVVADMCERVMVMYAGKIIEFGAIDDIFYRPGHPYTLGLLESVPRLDTRRDKPLQPIIGTPPDLFDPPQGCPFFPRCSHAMEICRKNMPDLDTVGDNHKAACWLNHPFADSTAFAERRMRFEKQQPSS